MKKIKGEVLLFTTSIIWGTSFIAQIVGMEHIGPFTFTASRTLIGAISLIPVIIFMKIKRRNDITYDEPQGTKLDLIKGGVACGLAMFGGISFQQYGLQYTTAGKAGFITAMYIVLVPVFSLILKKKIKKSVWLGIGIGLIGLYFLSITENFTIAKGDLIVLLGTFFWALQIIIVDHFASKVDGLRMSFIQFSVAGVISLIIGLVFENISIGSLLSSAFPILYAGIVVVGIAYTLQIIGQKDTNPTAAAIILSMESVFAAIFGMIILGETMNLREIVGCVLMFAAVLIAEIQPSIKEV